MQKYVFFPLILLLGLVNNGYSHDHIALCSMPKSGSTFLSRILAECINGNIVGPYIGEDAEQEFLEHKLIPLLNQSWVTHAHARATKNVLSLLKKYKLDPVIQFRNLIDLTCSLHDHFINESSVNAMQNIFIDDFLNKNKTERYDFIIDLILPWYLNFYCGWMSAIYNNQCRAYVLWYEDFCLDPASTVQNILNFSNFNMPKDKTTIKITHVLKTKNTRFNKGIIGRGFSELTTEQIYRINKMASHYKNLPWFDIQKLAPTSIEDLHLSHFNCTQKGLN